LKIPPTENYNIQIYKKTNSKLTFEKRKRFKKRQNKNHTHYNIQLNKDGKVFAVKDLSEDFMNCFSVESLLEK